MSKAEREQRPFDVEAPEAHNASLVRHEERLSAAVERVESGRVEVRKRIVVEEISVTVPVRREVADVVRVYDDGSEEVLDVPPSTWQPRIEDRAAGAEPDDAAEQPRAARPNGAGRHSIVLHEERPVIMSELFAVERLDIAVSEQRGVVTVTDEARREVIEVDGVEDRGERGGRHGASGTQEFDRA